MGTDQGFIAEAESARTVAQRICSHLSLFQTHIQQVSSCRKFPAISLSFNCLNNCDHIKIKYLQNFQGGTQYAPFGSRETVLVVGSPPPSPL